MEGLYMMTRETFGDLPIFIMKNGARLFRQVGAGGAWDVDSPGAVDVDSAEEGGELGGVLHPLDGSDSAAVQLGVARRQEPAEWAWEKGVMCSPGSAGCEWYCLVCLLLLRLGMSRHSSMRNNNKEKRSMRLQIDDSSMRSCQRGHRQECLFHRDTFKPLSGKDEHFKETPTQTTSDKANKHSHLRTITAILMATHHSLSTHSQRQIPQLIYLHEGAQIAHIIAVVRRGEHREDLVVVIRRVSLWRTRIQANTVITAS